MRWPRGRLNGQRIVGLNLRIIIDVTDWRWLPRVYWQHGTAGAIWLCVFVVLYCEYEPVTFDRKAGGTNT